MEFDGTERSLAVRLDGDDPLSRYRDEFVIADPGTIYLDGNSLGRLSRGAAASVMSAVEIEWGERLIRGWNEGWLDLPGRLGSKIARMIGAEDGEVIVCDSTSVNLFKLAAAALSKREGRIKVVSDVLNFPSDIYVLEGLIEFLGGRHRLDLVGSRDGMTVDEKDIASAVDDDTALVVLTHVAFKSAFMYDMARITEIVRVRGAEIIWDLSHSAGAVPLDMRGCGAGMAVGCTYKYLNGGPGAPAFLYVRKDLQEEIIQPLWGWFACSDPFSFGMEFEAARGISRFRVGTPHILSMKAIEPSLDLILEAGIDRLREKSVMMTEYILYLAARWLEPFGFITGSPADPGIRGSHVSLRHPEGMRICKAMIEGEKGGVRVIPDFREPDNIRLGVAPLYLSFAEIHDALSSIRTIMEKKSYEDFTDERPTVT